MEHSKVCYAFLCSLKLRFLHSENHMAIRTGTGTSTGTGTGEWGLGGPRRCLGNLLLNTDRSVAAGSNRRRMTGDAGSP